MATYSGFKWGGSAAPSSGGVVTWSFATLAGRNYSFTSAIAQQAYRDAIAAAFDLWESVANIDFQFTATDATNVDIRLGWDTIDGSNGIVGQAVTYFTPRTGYDGNSFSEIRFDNAENWAAGSDTSGIDFFAVAIHEIGHTLGLEHSTDRASIMYPTVGGHALSANDITIIRALYGAPVVVVAPTTGDDSLNGTASANTIDGLAGNDTISGAGGNDKLYGSGGNDALYGGSGIDSAYGGDGSDTIDGGTEADVIYGGVGGDNLLGGGGSDKIYGEDGDDTISGGSGNDRLTGGDGDDTINSGIGSDVFVFKAGNDADLYNGFANGYDKIDLSSYNFASFAAVKALAHMAGTDLVLDFGAGDTITIDNFAMSKLSSGDFIL